MQFISFISVQSLTIMTDSLEKVFFLLIKSLIYFQCPHNHNTHNKNCKINNNNNNSRFSTINNRYNHKNSNNFKLKIHRRPQEIGLTWLRGRVCTNGMFGNTVLLTSHFSKQPNLAGSKFVRLVYPSLQWSMDSPENSGVNFTNIIRAAFAPIFLRQKSTNLKSKYKKVSCETFLRKSRA